MTNIKDLHPVQRPSVPAPTTEQAKAHLRNNPSLINWLLRSKPGDPMPARKLSPQEDVPSIRDNHVPETPMYSYKGFFEEQVIDENPNITCTEIGYDMRGLGSSLPSERLSGLPPIVFGHYAGSEDEH